MVSEVSKPNMEGITQGNVEEMLANLKRHEAVKDFFSVTTNELLKEGQKDRRRTGVLREKLVAAEKKADEAEKKANHDKLTGLLNREGFLKIIREAKAKGLNGALLVLDIDKFKSINDTFGHIAGDVVLKTVAQYLQEHCRTTDVICRWGGEEIVIYFPKAATKEIKTKFTPKGSDQAKINVPVYFEPSKEIPKGENFAIQPDILVTFSGGITDYDPEEALETAINRADQVLYEIKKTGRNRLEMDSRIHG